MCRNATGIAPTPDRPYFRRPCESRARSATASWCERTLELPRGSVGGYVVRAFEDKLMVPLEGEGYYGLGSGLCCVYASEIE